MIRSRILRAFKGGALLLGQATELARQARGQIIFHKKNASTCIFQLFIFPKQELNLLAVDPEGALDPHHPRSIVLN